MTTHSRPAPDSCSVLHETTRLPAFGTAARANAWVALEQNGPWGAKAPTQSHLDPELGRALDERAEQITARFALIRNPAGHADVADAQRRVFLAGGLEHSPWLVTGTVPEPATLMSFDWALLREPTPDAVLAAVDGLAPAVEPVLLICTNGKRDVCCAVRGRPVAVTGAEQRPGLVWETNHTGGHRFAPTGVLLPWGATLARLDETLVVLAVDAARRNELAPILLDDFHHRGRSALPPREQAAEHYVRQLVGDLHLGGFATAGRPDGLIEVTRTGGHTWLVQVEERGHWPDLPASCGKPAVPVTDWDVRILH